MIRNIALIIIVCILTGCATIPDPVKYEEKSNVSPSKIAAKKVLVIFDMSIEYPFLPSGLIYSKEDNINKTYGEVAKTIVKSINDQGIEAEYKIHSSKAPLQIPSEGYSHILIEKLDKFTNVSSDQGNYTQYRLWDAQLLELTSLSSGNHTVLFTQTYSSDGVSCFFITLYGNKPACQAKYLELLMSHLSPIGITNKVVRPTSQ
jgi:hypothetical protein